MLQAEEPYITIVIGGMGIGKTYHNIEAAKIYVKDNLRTGKRGRKVLILNFNNEDGYSKFKTLPPTREAISRFVTQKTVEIRQITKTDLDGTEMSIEKKIDVMSLVLNNFKNGLAIFDDVDGYAAYGSSSNKALITTLMNIRHRGCHAIFVHQSWRKMGVSETENLRFIRLHKVNDTPMALSLSKLTTLDMHACMIAHYLVEMQYDLAEKLYNEKKLTYEQAREAKSYHIYIDRWTKKIFPGTGKISDHNFALAVRRYASRSKKIMDDEIAEMIFEGTITQKQKNTIEVQRQAVERLIKKFKYKYLKN